MIRQRCFRHRCHQFRRLRHRLQNLQTLRLLMHLLLRPRPHRLPPLLRLLRQLLLPHLPLQKSWSQPGWQFQLQRPHPLG
jgi:hypothetical protein